MIDKLLSSSGKALLNWPLPTKQSPIFKSAAPKQFNDHLTETDIAILVYQLITYNIKTTGKELFIHFIIQGLSRLEQAHPKQEAEHTYIIYILVVPSLQIDFGFDQAQKTHPCICK